MLLGAQRLDKTGENGSLFSKDQDWGLPRFHLPLDQPLGYMGVPGYGLLDCDEDRSG